MINIRQGTNDDAYAAFYANSHMEGRYTAYIRGKRCGSVSDFMKEYSAAFQFPAYFGENWNAWDECACDLDWLVFSSIAIVIDDYDRMFSLTADPQDEKLHFENVYPGCMRTGQKKRRFRAKYRFIRALRPHRRPR